MLTDVELQGLARTVADLPPDQERAVADAVAEIRAERARLDEERLAGLRSMTDLQVVTLMRVQDLPGEAAVTLLREAGFVRAAVLEKAYREGYERGAFDAHTGPGAVPTLPDEDDLDYVAMRRCDLADLMKGW